MYSGKTLLSFAPLPMFEKSSDPKREAFTDRCSRSGLSWLSINSVLYFSKSATAYNEEVYLLLLYLAVQIERGHICVELESFEKGMREAFPPEMEIDSSLISSLKNECHKIVKENRVLFGTSEESTPFVYDSGKRLYPRRHYCDERHFLQLLKERLQFSKDSSNQEVDGSFIVKNVADSFSFQLNREMEEAIEKSLSTNFLIITGGPGTGKTTTASAILKAHCLKAESEGREAPTLLLAAPTGRAASHLLETLNKNREEGSSFELPKAAFTLHRLLSRGRRRDASYLDEVIDPDLLIVDEASMIDLALFKQLLESVSIKTKIILLGDMNQLPSVERGTLLTDMLEGVDKSSHTLYHSVVKLKRVYRSVDTIIKIAEKVVQGDVSVIDKLKSFTLESTPIGYHPLPEPKQLIYYLLKRVRQGIKELKSPARFNSRSEMWENHQKSIAEWFLFYQRLSILSPLKQGLWGADWINRELDSAFGGRCYPGKPLLVTENRPEINLFNGDMGILFHFTDGWYLFFEERGANTYRRMALSSLPQHETGYARTIHKSQGSEFSEVIVVAPLKGERLLSREILYTAVTRAKERLLILGEEEALKRALSLKIERISGIAESLQ